MSDKLRLAIQAARELGFERISQYIQYQAGLRSGFYRLRTPSRPCPPEEAPQIFLELVPVPDIEAVRQLYDGRIDGITKLADEIVEGKVRLFGGEAVPLELTPPGELTHWSQARKSHGDIKLVWEPARFGWVFALARAYLLTMDERYPAAFWQRWEEFHVANPINMGPNWESAQEVALRLISLVWAAKLFDLSPHSTAERKARLTASLIDHARRIPVTLAYARAQNNNHLVSEAAGLFTAGVVFKEFKEAKNWKRLGWKWFNRAVQSQFENDGEYIQHSTNYHRLVLQIALLVCQLASQNGENLPSTSQERLEKATLWLFSYMDPISGYAANLGHNDGANPLPLADAEYGDYRPVAQAAAIAFGRRRLLQPGPWDEYPLWLGLPLEAVSSVQNNPSRRIDRQDEWASMRVVRYNSRPAHADQLQVALWYRGINILLDPGTYSYNADPPWDNGLAKTDVHNSLTVDGLDQMRRVGRFLWLDWAQAGWNDEERMAENRLTAWHNGYKKSGIKIQRTLSWLSPGCWQVRDKVYFQNNSDAQSRQFMLNWLLPDGKWEIHENHLKLSFPDLRINLSIDWTSEIGNGEWNRLVRAGKVLYGIDGDVQRFGWVSPTYNVLKPALSFQTGMIGSNTLEVVTTIKLESIDKDD